MVPEELCKCKAPEHNYTCRHIMAATAACMHVCNSYMLTKRYPWDVDHEASGHIAPSAEWFRSHKC